MEEDVKRYRALLALGVLALAVAAASTPAIQIDSNKVAKPPKDSALTKAGCLACHVKDKPTTLNAYGKDMQVAMKAMKTTKLTPAVLARIAKLDSDKDKFTNAQELKAGTLPGDPKSKPKK